MLLSNFCLELGCCGRTPGGSGLLLSRRKFDKGREPFLDAVLVEFPDSSKAVYSQTDGSGAERYQLLDNGERGVIGFASRILRGPGLLYTVPGKERLAIIVGLQKYWTILETKVSWRTHFPGTAWD
jgi:hypothetical protein